MAYRQFDQPNTPEIPKTPEYGLYNQAFLQAMSNQNQRAENEKQRANARAVAEIKKPSFKISNAESPFSKDTDAIAKNVNIMLDPSVDDNTRAFLDQKNQYIASKGKSQEKQFTGLQQNLAPLLQKWGKNADFSKFNELENKIRTEDDITTRDKTLNEFGSLQSRPEDYVDGDGLVIDFHKSMDEIPLTYKEDIKKGGRTESKDFTITTKYPVESKEPLLNPDGSQSIIDGKPQFKSREPRNPQELMPYVDYFLKSDKDVKRVIYAQTYRKNKSVIDNNAKTWAKSMELSGQKPTEEEMQSYMDGQTEKLAKESVATTLFSNDRARIEGGRKVSLDEPTEAQQEKSESKRNLRKIGGSSTNVAGNVLIPSKNVKSEYDSRLGKTSDTNRVNSMLFQKDKNGNFTDIDAQTFSLSGDITDETTGEKFKITENEPAVAKNVYPVLEHYNDKTKKWVRTKFDPNHTDKDFEANINHYGSKGIPVRVSMQGDINISTKQNKTGTMSPEEMQELNTLKNVKERDETQNARLGVLEGKLAKELGRTVRVNMEESGILKQVTGFDNMEEVAKNADNQEIKKIAENNIKWKRLAESYNSKSGNKVVEKTTVTKVKGIAVPMAKPKVTTIKKADIATKAKAAGYSVSEYTELLRGNGITIE